MSQPKLDAAIEQLGLSVAVRPEAFEAVREAAIKNELVCMSRGVATRLIGIMDAGKAVVEAFAATPALPLLQETPAATQFWASNDWLNKLLGAAQKAKKEWSTNICGWHAASNLQAIHDLDKTDAAFIELARPDTVLALLAAALPLQYKQERPGPIVWDINKLWAYLDEVVELHTSAESGQVYRHFNKSMMERFAAGLTEAAAATPVATVGSEPLGPHWIQMLVGISEPPHNRVVDIAFTCPGEPAKMHRASAYWNGMQWINAGRAAGQDMDFYTIHYWLNVPEIPAVPEVDTLPIPPTHAV